MHKASFIHSDNPSANDVSLGLPPRPTWPHCVRDGARRRNRCILPLVMWHGFGQFGKSWETTADGRESFQNIFLR